MNYWTKSSTATKVAIAVAVTTLLCGCLLISAAFWAYVLQPEAEPPVAEDSWSRIQAAGKIRVGTAADYPPFEYYTGDFQIDGFDIALMNEIGRRLGVEVEFFDYAFDGLSGALELDQIDAAIAALSVTPEREAFLDFSNVYFVTEDAILAHQDASIIIGHMDELASFAVGVQRGSIHEDWVQTSLVDTGKMPSSNLFSFAKPEDATAHLMDNRVDLVILDALPAESFEEQGGVRLVGRGLNEQRYAVAVQKGASSLKAQIDRALTELNNEGKIAQLAEQYLGLAPEDIPPMPTSTPVPAVTSTPGPPPSCVDGMTLVEHLTYDDNDMLAPPVLPPGQAFTKGWRVSNTGTCTWNSSYRLVYAHGNTSAAGMGGEPVAVAGEVPPDGAYDIQVDLVAPLTPGTHRGFWQLQNGQGVAFGELIWVGIEVPAPGTPTPAPTQTPSTGISFYAEPTRIKAGEKVVFTWDVAGAKAVYFYAEGERWEDNGVVGQGSEEVYPPVTMSYFLRVVRLDDAVEVRDIRIEVESVADAPDVYRFTVDPPSQIAQGECVDIRWGVQGSVDAVTITANSAVLWDNAPTSGHMEDCPSAAGTVAYMVEATGPGGTSRRQQMINVLPTGTATPEPTAAPGLPVIYSFSVTPSEVQVEDCVEVSWSVGGDADRVQIWLIGLLALDNAEFDGSELHCPQEAGIYTYRLDAYNIADEVVSEEATVEVTEGTPG